MKRVYKISMKTKKKQRKGKKIRRMAGIFKIRERKGQLKDIYIIYTSKKKR